MAQGAGEDTLVVARRRVSGIGSDLAAVHVRFARTVLATYLITAGVAVLLLVSTLETDREHQETTARDTLLLGTETRGHFLSRELGLLASELRRLGLRSEVDLLDENMAPEESLLRLSHEKSSFFNVGVAIVDPTGKVVWTLPAFLTVGTSVAQTAWFRTIQHSDDVRIVPVSPESPEDSLIYLVSPISRAGTFSGALVGAIDLATGSGELDPQAGFGAARDVMTVIATRDGTVVYPPRQPDFAGGPAWKSLFASVSQDPFVTTVTLGGVERVVASDVVPAAIGLIGSPDMVMLSIIDADALHAPARGRLRTRLVFGLAIAMVPIVLLLLMLRRTLKQFQSAQEQAARDERLRMLGEASNLIAHEIKNTLNGLQIGIDVLLRPPRAGAAIGAPAEPRPQTLAALRSEIGRLSTFTTELLTFSRGVKVRLAPMDLAEHTRKVCEVLTEMAEEHGLLLEVETPESLPVRADPTLIHVIISNLVQNAIDATAPLRPPSAPSVRVRVERSERGASVWVSDNGPGIPVAVSERLFEPFVTGKPSGVGIGLALSRKIARAHEGDLVLEESEVGAAFHLWIPAAEPASERRRG